MILISDKKFDVYHDKKYKRSKSSHGIEHFEFFNQ